MIKKLINLSNHLDKKGLQKEADYLDSILKKLASEPDEETSIRLSEAEEEFYDPNFPDIEVKVVYDDWEPAWDQTRWHFILNGEKVSFITGGGGDVDSIAYELTDEVGIKAGIATRKRFGSVSWYDIADYGGRSEYKEYIYGKLLPYVENIKRLKKDLKEAYESYMSYQN